MLELDLVTVPGRTIQLGHHWNAVHAAWRTHHDLDLPWHYFAKEVGSLVVEVAEFRVQRCPLTWAELKELDSGLARRLMPSDANARQPADGLSFEEAQHVADSAAELMGVGIRLMSEAEWELAARGPDDREFPWGDTYDPRLCNLREAGHGRPLPVGQFRDGASADGLLDMAGNVDEWSSTIYMPYPGAPEDTPATEPWAADPHVTRGGSWSHARDLARCRRRHAVYPPLSGAGLRLCLSP